MKKKNRSTRWNWPSIVFDVAVFGLCYRLIAESMTTLRSADYREFDTMGMFLRMSAAMIFSYVGIAYVERSGPWRR